MTSKSHQCSSIQFKIGLVVKLNKRNNLPFVRKLILQQTCKIGPMLAISWQGWQNVGKFANALPMLPMFCQHFCKSRNYCSSKFPRIFSRLFNGFWPFSFTCRCPICQKCFFLLRFSQCWWNIGSTLVANIGIMHFNQYRANVGCQPQANITG